MKIGTRVSWTSSNTKKEGVITHIVPAGKRPYDIGVQKLGDGIARDHETYVVRGQHVFRGNAEGRKANYWPLVSLLTFHHDEPTAEERLAQAMTMIATFPITDPANQDAVNMQKIAMEALKWSDSSSAAA